MLLETEDKEMGQNIVPTFNELSVWKVDKLTYYKLSIIQVKHEEIIKAHRRPHSILCLIHGQLGV